MDSRLCLVPKSDYQIIDSWQAMGMSATGSKDVAATDTLVPEQRALALSAMPRRLRSPGRGDQRGPLFGIPCRLPQAIRSRPRLVGAAEGAYELFLASMAKRSGTYTGAKVADFRPCRSRSRAPAC